jgi:hypothetical protein
MGNVMISSGNENKQQKSPWSLYSINKEKQK